jgi:hypothetical protein
MARQNKFDENFSSPLDELLGSSLLEGFEVVGSPRNNVAIHSDASLELKRYVAAAVIAHQLGLRSLDYALKKYAKDLNLKPHTDKERNLCTEILEQVKNNIDQTIEWMDKVENKPGRIGLFSAVAALMRLQASFAIASSLIKRGYNFEALSICRLILEQVAWAYDVHELEDETVFKRNPSNSIAKLKKILPEMGRLYGLLCKQVHISPHLVFSYMTVKEGNPVITLATTDGSADRAFILLSLADAFTVVSEYIYKDIASIVSDFSCLVKDKEGRYCLNKSRKLSKTIEHYRSAISKRKLQQKKEPK